MSFKNLPPAMNEDFLMIPHGVWNIWTELQFSGKFSWVLINFRLILHVYFCIFDLPKIYTLILNYKEIEKAFEFHIFKMR